jgi:hypothetical protein
LFAANPTKLSREENTTMLTNRKKLTALALGIVAATACSGLPAAPAAHAAANCTVPGARLDLRHSTGYDLTVDASGASLGPTGVVRTPRGSSPETVSGGINGRVVDFTLNWPGTKAATPERSVTTVPRMARRAP